MIKWLRRKWNRYIQRHAFTKVKRTRAVYKTLPTSPPIYYVLKPTRDQFEVIGRIQNPEGVVLVNVRHVRTGVIVTLHEANVGLFLMASRT